MEVSEKKSVTLIRVAAIILIISALGGIICHLGYHIVSSDILGEFRNLFGSFNFINVIGFIGFLASIFAELVCPVGAVATAIFIFMKKDKLVGIVIMIWGGLVFLANIVETGANLIVTGLRIGNIYYHLVIMIECLILFLLFLGLGLLYLGKFKEKSKKIGIILAALFVIVFVVYARDSIYDLDGLLSIGGGFERALRVFFADLFIPLFGLLVYVAHTLLSFVGASKEHPVLPKSDNN